MMKLSMGLPSKDEEVDILKRYLENDPLEQLEPLLHEIDLLQAQQEVQSIHVEECILKYIVDITAATRQGGDVQIGVSPRGTLALLHCVKAYAYLQGRKYVIPDDVIKLAKPVLAHRIIMGYGYGASKNVDNFIDDIISKVQVPTEEFKE